MARILTQIRYNNYIFKNTYPYILKTMLADKLKRQIENINIHE
jgi:hypothetical protein